MDCCTRFKQPTVCCVVGRHSVADLATRYGLVGPGAECQWGARFFASVQTGSVARVIPWDKLAESRR